MKLMTDADYLTSSPEQRPVVTPQQLKRSRRKPQIKNAIYFAYTKPKQWKVDMSRDRFLGTRSIEARIYRAIARELANVGAEDVVFGRDLKGFFPSYRLECKECGRPFVQKRSSDLTCPDCCSARKQPKQPLEGRCCLCKKGFKYDKPPRNKEGKQICPNCRGTYKARRELDPEYLAKNRSWMTVHRKKKT